MKTSTLFVIAATTIVAAGGAGVLIARATNANAGGQAMQCGAPTVVVDIASGSALLTAGPDAVASCDNGICRIEGPNQVEVQADGRTQCLDVTQGETLELGHSAGELSVARRDNGN